MKPNENENLKNNLTAIEGFLASMNMAVTKAKNGSTVEDDYFLEKLEKIAHRLGYNLVKQ